MTTARPLPPLSQPLAAHPLYSEILSHGSSCHILDVGSGLGKDLLELIANGADPSEIVAVDCDAGLREAALRLCKARFPDLPSYRYVVQDLTKVFDRTISNLSYHTIVCYKVLHLLPPTHHELLLSCLLALLSRPCLSNSSSSSSYRRPSLILGLQRSHPPGHPSSYEPISNSPNADELKRHWLCDPLEFEEMLKRLITEKMDGEGARGGGGKWNCGVDYLDGASAGVGRGACRWWIRCDDDGS